MIDGVERVTGRVPYTIDLRLPGMLHVRFLRSVHPHANLLDVDVARARRSPGVVAVLAAADLERAYGRVPTFGPVLRDQPVLAHRKTRFAGEPIVAVAAHDLDAADAALEQVDVEYEELPGVFTSAEALANGAPLVHDEPVREGPTFADINLNRGAASNVCNTFRLRHGDIDRALAEADLVVEGTYSSPPVQHVPLETHACVAHLVDGRLTVWSTTQIPYLLRAQLAELFGLAQSRIRIIVPTLGGAYGAKCYPSIEPATVALALATGRPVRLHLTRAEEFVTITKHAADVRLTTGVTSDGRLIAQRAESLFNTGAYADIGPRVIKVGGYGVAGPYRIPTTHFDATAVYTNRPPAGAFRGYGIAQVAWAYESQMDEIADQLGMDPVDLRARNLLHDGDTFATGQRMDGCHFDDLLNRSAASIGWQPGSRSSRDGSLVRAKGVSCIIKGTTTPSTSTALVTLNGDDTVHIATSTVEMGQGSRTALAIIGAEALGVALDAVTISYVDTDATPYDQQTSASRSTHAMGSAILDGVEQLDAMVLQEAARQRGCAPDALELRGGLIHEHGSADPVATRREIVSRSGLGSLTVIGRFRSAGGLDPATGQGIASDSWHQGAGAAEVEVDLETGRVTVLDYVGSVYAGRIVSERLASLQTEGNITFGIGQALFEELVFDGGQIVGPNLGDYMVPGIRDLPGRLEIDVVGGDGDRHMHGLGETALPPVMAAVGNAVARAIGVRIRDLPITPEKVLRALEEREAPPAPDANREPDLSPVASVGQP